MSKEPPQEFDPHPGDPWHPDWALEAEADAEQPTDADDGKWWQRAVRGRRGTADREVPEAYAELTPRPTDLDPAANVPADASPAELDAVATSVPADTSTPELDAVARAFGDELGPAPDPISERVEAAKAEAADAAVAIKEADAEQSVAAADDIRVTIDLRSAAPDEVESPAREASSTAPDLDEEDEVAALASPTAAPEPVESPEQVAALASRTAVRSREHAAELAMIDRLARAERAAHEESAMWTAVAGARDEEELILHSPENEVEVITRAPLDESWAEKAILIEEARQRFDESRRRTEAEVQEALERAVSAVPAAASHLDAAAVAAKFSAIAAQLRLEDAATADRMARNEELRLRTSLLVLDAEHLWDSGGWSRPGSSLNAKGAVFTDARPRAAVRIGTTSPSAVPESSSRRRWPWSRKRNTPTAPSAPQNSLRSVVVIEERSVSGRADEPGDEQQESLPLDGLDSPDAAEPTPAPFDEPVDLDAGLEGLSDLDWDTDDLADSPRAADSGGESQDIPAIADETDWEDFTAQEYVQTATQEYADLAAAVAAAESEVPEQAAITADMPGMESSLVGLEDVVAAEGMEAADAAPRSDLALRVVTGLGLVALFFASLTYRWSIGLLVAVVMTIAAGELATVLVRQGRHPVALFAYLGTLGAILGVWAYGPVAIPVAAAVSMLAIVLYFGLVAGREDPLVGMALTVMVVLWVGVFAAFALDLVEAPEYRWLIGGLVVVVAVMDVAQYFVGKRFGKRPLAPQVSPKKTVAGLVGGVVAAVAVGYGLSVVAEPIDTNVGIVLGATLALTGPIGDLAVSVLKRTLGVKDMGAILPGHGGVLDRIDAILFSIPAAWLVYAWAGLLG